MTDKEKNPQTVPAGDSCIVVDFGDAISLEVNAMVQTLRKTLASSPIMGLMELMPTYRSLAIYFNPVETDIDDLKKKIEKAIETLGSGTETGLKEAVIPVCYGGKYGPDLENVADHHGITSEEVIKKHSSVSCYCYMLGFTPGFSYLGGMDESIATPRLKNPRELIPAGSVGIAGSQTGIYPIDSPGGWQLIGRTPLRMYDPAKTPPTLLDAGLWVRFKPITEEEYLSIEAEVRSGRYSLDIVLRGENR